MLNIKTQTNMKNLVAQISKPNGKNLVEYVVVIDGYICCPNERLPFQDADGNKLKIGNNENGYYINFPAYLGDNSKQERLSVEPRKKIEIKKEESSQEAETEGIEKAWNRGNAYSMQQMRLQQAMEERELLGGFTREEWENEI